MLQQEGGLWAAALIKEGSDILGLQWWFSHVAIRQAFQAAPSVSLFLCKPGLQPSTICKAHWDVGMGIGIQTAWPAEEHSLLHTQHGLEILTPEKMIEVLDSLALVSSEVGALHSVNPPRDRQLSPCLKLGHFQKETGARHIKGHWSAW